MADPRGYMAFKCQTTAAQKRSSLRDFGNAVGKVGDLEVLNSVGGGAVGRGLRTLSSISNTIRTGCGALPTSIGSTIEAGANWVLENTGIAPTVVEAVRNFNPGIANQAYGQAKAIFEAVSNGRFKGSDIPGVLQDIQNLERLGRNIFTPNTAQGVTSIDCLNSPYAMDLIARAPKHKFMFVVQFIFEQGYGELESNQMAFVVKKSTRPNIKFETEDVNYYNFRTQVISKTTFEPMTMTFHDDMSNQSMLFYNAYRNAMSPITNMDAAQGLVDPENGGMAFDGIDTGFIGYTTIGANRYTGSRGPLLNEGSDVKNIIKTIRMFHIYEGGRLMNVFHFLNPRITQMTLDDVDMSETAGTEVGITFSYDSVYLETDVPANRSDYVNSADSLPGQQTGALYPLRYNGTAGAMNDAHKAAAALTPASPAESCSAINNTNTSIPNSVLITDL